MSMGITQVNASGLRAQSFGLNQDAQKSEVQKSTWQSAKDYVSQNQLTSAAAGAGLAAVVIGGVMYMRRGGLKAAEAALTKAQNAVKNADEQLVKAFPGADTAKLGEAAPKVVEHKTVMQELSSLNKELQKLTSENKDTSELAAKIGDLTKKRDELREQIRASVSEIKSKLPENADVKAANKQYTEALKAHIKENKAQAEVEKLKAAKDGTPSGANNASEATA